MTSKIVKSDLWFDVIDHDAVMDAMAALGLDISWDYPGIVRIMVDPVTSVATGLHGYEYGSVSTLVSGDDMWDESLESADPAISEGETDPATIARGWADWVDARGMLG